MDLTKAESRAIREYLESKGLPSNVAVTFKDVALPEAESDIRSRAEIIDFRSNVVPNFQLDIPFVSANMESVTGYDLAVALEREGGLAFIPQMLPLSERLEILERVRRADCAFIDTPLSITREKTLKEAKELMERFEVMSLVVVDDGARPIGMLSTRDWCYETDERKSVKELMSPRVLIKASLGVEFDVAARILREHRVEKLPLIDRAGKLAGLITAHGLFYRTQNPRALRDSDGRFRVAGTMGVGRTVTKEYIAEIAAQCERGIELLLIDTARAFSVNAKEALIAVKKEFPKLPVVIGNVSTPEGAKFLFENGADAVKVNQGRGFVCRTSQVGVGIPQLTAIATCGVIARRYGKCIVADGGVKNPGDCAKALAAGADTLMSGYLFIGTYESRAELHFNKAGLPVKLYEGSASFHAQARRIAHGTLETMRRPEGVSEEVHVTGTLKEKIEDLLKGLQSAMSYCGVRSVAELRAKTRFALQSQEGLREGVKE